MNDTTTGPSGSLDGHPILVHKEGAEGGITIGSLSGRILTPIMERPDWSEGLAVAKLADYASWSQSRLGKSVVDYKIIAFEALGWVCVDAVGEEFETEADAEYRMNVIADHVGILRTNDLSSAEQDDTDGELAHVLLDETNDYQHNQPRAIEWTEALASAARNSEKKVVGGN